VPCKSRAEEASQRDLPVSCKLPLGLRYETQTNIHDWRDLAPRLAFAWAPGRIECTEAESR